MCQNMSCQQPSTINIIEEDHNVKINYCCVAVLLNACISRSRLPLPMRSRSAPERPLRKMSSNRSRMHLRKSSGIQLSIVSSGPKIAMQDLEKGSVDAAAAGLSFDDWMALMKKEGSEVKDPSLFKQAIIGKDKIVVLVHKDNPVSKLSKEQLKGIFTGKIGNWKEVGGKDLSIIIVWGKLIPGTNSMFVKNMLDGEQPAERCPGCNDGRGCTSECVFKP